MINIINIIEQIFKVDWFLILLVKFFFDYLEFSMKFIEFYDEFSCSFNLLINNFCFSKYIYNFQFMMNGVSII